MVKSTVEQCKLEVEKYDFDQKKQLDIEKKAVCVLYNLYTF